MSPSGQSWKQEVNVSCVRSPVTALTRRRHPLRFAGRFGSADRLAGMPIMRIRQIVSALAFYNFVFSERPESRPKRHSPASEQEIVTQDDDASGWAVTGFSG